jgi:ssDNA-binding Zn-finger/Zn-ribbon topoisomerase 1
MEESLDKIATGRTNWLDYMNIFYDNLKKVIDSTSETGMATDLETKICPLCNSVMVVRRSRFGKLFYGCSTYPKCSGIINI